MSWSLLLDIIYLLILLLLCLRIIYDTNSPIKTLAYLLLAIFVPIAGIIFYFSIGINYRKRRVYSKKLIRDDKLRIELEERIVSNTQSYLAKNANAIRYGGGLVHL